MRVARIVNNNDNREPRVMVAPARHGSDADGATIEEVFSRPLNYRVGAQRIVAPTEEERWARRSRSWPSR